MEQARKKDVQKKRQRKSDEDKYRQLRRTAKALIGRIRTYGPVELGLLFSELLQIETALRFRAIQIEQERKGNFACGHRLSLIDSRRDQSSQAPNHERS